MQQKIVTLHSNVNQNGYLMDFNLDEEIEKLKNEGWTVKQISSCSSCKYLDSRGTTTFVHLFLLAEKP